jgi:hypothetical protein
MTPLEMQGALERIYWPNYHLARQLGCNEKLVRKWLAGLVPIPPRVGDWLARLAAAHAVLPPPAPAEWRQEQSLAATR